MVHCLSARKRDAIRSCCRGPRGTSRLFRQLSLDTNQSSLFRHESDTIPNHEDQAASVFQAASRGAVGATRNWLSGNLEEQFPVTRRPFRVPLGSASPGCHSASRNIVAAVPRVQEPLAVFIAAYYVSRGCSGGRRGVIHRPLSSQHCSEAIGH